MLEELYQKKSKRLKSLFNNDVRSSRATDLLTLVRKEINTLKKLKSFRLGIKSLFLGGRTDSSVTAVRLPFFVCSLYFSIFKQSQRTTLVIEHSGPSIHHEITFAFSLSITSITLRRIKQKRHLVNSFVDGENYFSH